MEAQTVNGPQTKIEGGVHGPVLSGEFRGPVTFQQSAPPPQRTPLQKPARAQHFTGREDELATLLEDLQPGRIVTLCGPGGIGKTALAAEAIWTLAPESDPPELFPDGIIFHTFYHQPQSALALEAIARAYGEDPRPNPAEAAKRALSGRSALIVLDGAEAADDLDAVLDVVGGCGVLITSRRHRDAPAGWKDISPLPLEKAVQLLKAWGGDFASDGATASRICELLGRLPLAIFLAGRYMAERSQQAFDYLDWLKTTPLDALDLGERQHRSVPLLMERSLEEVDESSRAALGIAGILALEPFDPQIVAIALNIDRHQANHFLGELVDYGMLLRPDASYQVTHSLLHTYARERLAPAHEALSRLAEHYATFAEEESKRGLSGYARLDSHRAHILSLQSACLAAGKWSDVRSLTWAIEDYLDLQGHWTDRVAAVEMGLEAARADGSRRDEGAFLIALGLTKAALGEPCRAIGLYEQSLAIFREIGDRRGEGAVLGNLGIAYKDLGELHRAIEFHEQYLDIAREIGDRRGEGNALGNLGLAYANLGDPRRAIELYEQHLDIAREIGDRRGEGNALGNLGLAYANLGDPRRAIEFYEKALTIDREIGDRRGEGNALGNMGSAYYALGELHRAIEFHEQYLDIAREIGDRRGEGNALFNMSNAYAALGDPRRAIELYEQTLTIDREIGDRRGEGNALFNMSLSLKTLGNRAQAIERAKAALQIHEELESPYAEQVRRKLDEWQEKGR